MRYSTFLLFVLNECRRQACGVVVNLAKAS
jgi:hypothetical protein